ncbi:hypothetical protein [Brevundimonas sp.]|uniref:hypothetical protein n=1 Tax=Brevundimonas sp. TaxID=1871086 RepID=UPI002615EDE9|nr:hypothetical protein [Brevundimonas sp.]
MRRLLAIVGGAVALGACVTVPGGESTVAAWSNGVTMTQRPVTYWEGASSFESTEGWVRNDSTGVRCLALKTSNAPGYVKTWTLRPGTNETMWPEMGQYNSRRYVPGRYGTWIPADGSSCAVIPANLALSAVGEG